jgi:hypothetical protein
VEKFPEVNIDPSREQNKEQNECGEYFPEPSKEREIHKPSHGTDENPDEKEREDFWDSHLLEQERKEVP